MGAMSPGPSLAIVVRHALTGGIVPGIAAATTHALAIGVYALATALGLALLVAQATAIGVALQVLGGAFLLYLGGSMLRASKSESSFSPADDVDDLKTWRASRDGFLVAFLNPKIMLFFAAVFSPFVRLDADFDEKLTLGGVAFLVDWLWFVVVVALVTRGAIVTFVRQHGWVMDKVFGALLAGFGVHLLGLAFGWW